jgi:hypothetical protein
MLDKELEHLDMRLRQPQLVADRHEVAFVRLIAEALMKYEFEGKGSDEEVRAAPAAPATAACRRSAAAASTGS